MADVKWPAALVRKTFFEYFEQRGHTLGTYPFPLLPPDSLSFHL